MSAIYELIGRLVVTVVRVRYRRELRIAAVATVAGVLAAGYLLASREVDEG
jgi:hypothetical protein